METQLRVSYTDWFPFLNRRINLAVSVPTALIPVVVVVVVVVGVVGGMLVLSVGQERTGKPAGVHPATVMVVKPDDKILVIVKVAVRVVVSWTVKPKQERSWLKLTIVMPQSPIGIRLFLPLTANWRKMLTEVRYESSSNELRIAFESRNDLKVKGAMVGSILQSIDKNVNLVTWTKRAVKPIILMSFTP